MTLAPTSPAAAATVPAAGRLAVFDLDHTLLSADSDYLWGRFLVERKLVDEIAYEAANNQFYADYQAGTLDIDAFCRFALAPLAEHDRALLEALRAEFIERVIVPIIAPGSALLLDRHRAAGDTLLITTATNRFVTEPIAALLGVENLIATDPQQVDGRYTGALLGIANFREGKVQRLQAWLAARAPLHYAAMCCYSDSRNDLPLLEMATWATAVDADATLRAEAERRGWPVISLRSADYAEQLARLPAFASTNGTAPEAADPA